ncbi:MAG: hypothetical protein GY768_31830 [Planctomycetaceae bacterium]|nr:hypothetical protein [Planctomycetaceae bacterium]
MQPSSHGGDGGEGIWRHLVFLKTNDGLLHQEKTKKLLERKAGPILLGPFSDISWFSPEQRWLVGNRLIT